MKIFTSPDDFLRYCVSISGCTHDLLAVGSLCHPALVRLSPDEQKAALDHTFRGRTSMEAMLGGNVYILEHLLDRLRIHEDGYHGVGEPAEISLQEVRIVAYQGAVSVVAQLNDVPGRPVLVMDMILLEEWLRNASEPVIHMRVIAEDNGIEPVVPT